MATVEEKLKLFETLQFVPCKYSIAIWGYGGEVVMGKIPRTIYDYFKHRRLDVSDYAWNYEYANEENIPENFQPFESGSWYECDDMAHVNGAETSCATLQITDDNGETVLETDIDNLDGEDVQLNYGDEAWVTQAKPGEVVFVGRSNEKGTFFEGEIELTRPFDPKLLELWIEEVDGESYVTSAFYDGKEIDNNGSNTNGKSSDFGFYLIKDDNSWESYLNHESIKYDLTEWFPKSIKPARLGSYTIKTAGRNSYEYQARWTGNRWIASWQDDVPETEDLKIKQWRGIAYDPNGEDTK